MILYNPTLADVETDNHWLPTVHLADGRRVRRVRGRRTRTSRRTFTAGVEGDGQGDVMAAFSSRGPGGLVHQARRHRAGRADPRRPHADAGASTERPARRATSRRSPARRCRRRTSPAPPRCSPPLHPDVDAGPDQVGADDDGDPRRRQGGRSPPRPTRSTSAPAASTWTSPPTTGLTFDETAANMAALGGDAVDGPAAQPARRSTCR